MEIINDHDFYFWHINNDVESYSGENKKNYVLNQR